MALGWDRATLTRRVEVFQESYKNSTTWKAEQTKKTYCGSLEIASKRSECNQLRRQNAGPQRYSEEEKAQMKTEYKNGEESPRT
ncbi:hypothetical protein JTB14_018407 [Gonioctena quinquepunctata]|nr:hypothetical protein JTB14_018407 [Gonioctena quinquepunctata]